MRVDVTMPNLGYDMEEGTVAAWIKQVGDAVERGEVIAEIETDKTTVRWSRLALPARWPRSSIPAGRPSPWVK